MANIIRPMGIEEAATLLVSTASTIGDSKVVRLVNTDTASVLVTVADVNDTTVGTFTMSPNEVVLIEKRQSDKVFAGAATVLMAPIAWPRG